MCMSDACLYISPTQYNVTKTKHVWTESNKKKNSMPILTLLFSNFSLFFNNHYRNNLTINLTNYIQTDSKCTIVKFQTQFIVYCWRKIWNKYMFFSFSFYFCSYRWYWRRVWSYRTCIRYIHILISCCRVRTSWLIFFVFFPHLL